MTYSDNLYLKRIAEKLTSPIEGQHTNNYYLKIISKNISKGGGGGSYDDTEIKRRITNVENGKQDKLTAGQNITIDANTIAAREIIDDTINSTTTVWSSKKVKDLIEALEGTIKVSIVTTRPDPSVAVDKTMYYVGTEAPYHIWFFVNDSYTDVGTTEISLENYYTKEEVDELLDLKVDKVTGKSLVLDTDITQITTNKNDIADLDSEKVDKETGKSLVADTDIAQIRQNKIAIQEHGDRITALDGSKQDNINTTIINETPTDSNYLSDVILGGTSPMNRRYPFSKIWDWIVGKLTSNTEKGIQVSGGKLGHTNAITVPTAKRILQATYDEQGHVKSIETEFNWSNNYVNSAENQLFTRKGANDMYTNYLKSTNGKLTKKSVVTNDYSHYVKCGNIYQFSIGFQNSSDIAKGAELYTLPASIASASIEMYIVISTVTGDTRVLQCGGSIGASKLCAKEAIPSGYWFGSAIFIKV